MQLTYNFTKVITKTDFDSFQKEFLDWVEEKIEKVRPDSGFPICPFARRARLDNKIQFIDGRENYQHEIYQFDRRNYDIGIVWLGPDANLLEAEKFVNRLKGRELLYFLSTPTSGHFAKNPCNCIFIQDKGDIQVKRKYLASTDYYRDWPEQYFFEIMNNV